MLGGMISDLETGDEFQPIRYVVTSLMTAEYAHGVEETDEWYFSGDNELGRQVRIPLMIHADKMRLLEVNCPKEARLSGIRGPDARVHYEYHARHRSPAYVGEELVARRVGFAAAPGGLLVGPCWLLPGRVCRAGWSGAGVVGVAGVVGWDEGSSSGAGDESPPVVRLEVVVVPAERVHVAEAGALDLGVGVAVVVLQVRLVAGDVGAEGL